MDNIFLKIAKKELPSYPVYEDDSVYAFLDREPYSKGHTLIVPKKHCPDIENLDEKTAAAILMAAKKIVVALRDLYKYEGVVLHQVNREKAQDVRHFHLHVYGTLSEDSTRYYEILPKNQEEKKVMFSKTAQEISSSIQTKDSLA